jgi:hypothetical protein
MIRRLILLCVCAAAGVAQSVYTATSGEVTLSVMAWSDTVVPPAIMPWRPVPVSGTWITACTSNANTAKLSAVISYKSGADVVKVVEDFPFLGDSGTGLHCGNILTMVKRETIVSVRIVTASIDFADI